MNGRVDGWMVGCVDGWMDGWMDGPCVLYACAGLETTNVTVTNVSVSAHGARGVHLTGAHHTVSDSTITDVGCRGVEVHCGVLETLAPGNCAVTGRCVGGVRQ